MNLSPEICLNGAIGTLVQRVMPSLDDRFALEAVRLASLLMTITANSLDDAVEIRVVEHAAMRAMFRDALTVIPDPTLQASLLEAAVSSDASLRVSELDVANGLLRGVLVDLHAFVEVRSENECRTLSKRIWRMLSDFEMARAPRR